MRLKARGAITAASSTRKSCQSWAKMKVAAVGFEDAGRRI
jgi:hypothetical protein